MQQAVDGLHLKKAPRASCPLQCLSRRASGHLDVAPLTFTNITQITYLMSLVHMHCEVELVLLSKARLFKDSRAKTSTSMGQTWQPYLG